jgi:hypothetical protein
MISTSPSSSTRTPQRASPPGSQSRTKGPGSRTSGFTRSPTPSSSTTFPSAANDTSGPIGEHQAQPLLPALVQQGDAGKVPSAAPFRPPMTTRTRPSKSTTANRLATTRSATSPRSVMFSTSVPPVRNRPGRGLLGQRPGHHRLSTGHTTGLKWMRPLRGGLQAHLRNPAPRSAKMEYVYGPSRAPLPSLPAAIGQ